MWLSCCFFQFHFFFFAGDKCCVAVNWERKKWWNNQHQTRQWSNTVLWYVIKIQWNLDKPHYSKQILTVPWAFVIWSSTVLWNCKSDVLSYMFAGMSLIASCQLHVVSLAEWSLSLPQIALGYPTHGRFWEWSWRKSQLDK